MSKLMKNNKKTAFSLIELSIVILIVSILATGAVSISITAINNAKIEATKKRIDEIYRAMGNFLLINGRLPCPANPALAKSSTDSTYGNEITNCATTTSSSLSYSSSNSNLVYGTIPVKALGLSIDMMEDSFGSKFAYIIDKNFTVKTSSGNYTGNSTFGTYLFFYYYDSFYKKLIYSYPTTTTTAPSSGGTTTAATIIKIDEKPSATTQTVSTKAIFSIISFGANKYGAYPANSTTQTSASSDCDEASNDNIQTSSCSESVNFDSTLVSSSGNSDSFDDIVFFKERNQMVTEFKAFSAIQCVLPANSTYFAIYSPTGSDPTYYCDYNSSYQELSRVLTSASQNSSCPSGYQKGPTYPAARCDAFGRWQAITNHCIN